MQRSAFRRSRRELSNEYLLAKIGFDTAENAPCKVCPLSAYRSLRFVSDRSSIFQDDYSSSIAAARLELLADVSEKSCNIMQYPIELKD